MLLRLAWRNLWRNRTRTLITGSAVALSFALLLVSMGVGDDTHARMEESAAKVAGGDVLVHGRGYWASQSGDIVIDDADAVLDAVRATPGVAAAIPRVVIPGLVSTSAGNRPVQLLGVVPGQEQRLQDIARSVEPAGSFLAGDESAPLVLGADIVEELDLSVGERVVLTATTPEGDLTRALFHLTGVLRSGTKELDEIRGYTTLAGARRAVSMEGRLTQIGVIAAPGVPTDTLARRLRAALAGRDLEVLTWQQAMPEMVGFIRLDDAFLYVYAVVIFLVVAFAIANTFLMSVMERVREFGLLSALGMGPRRVGRLLLGETALLTALSLVAGFLIGLAGHLAIRHWGIDLASFGTSDLDVSGVDIADMVMRSRINPVKWVVATGLVAALTVASALYPAWRAARLSPARAMRFYE